MTDKTQAELRDTCIKIQRLAGVVDGDFKHMFGVEEGLYGFITAHTNKQIEEALDRLENSIDDGKLSHSMNVIRAAIEAERNKLKELR